MTSAGHPKNRNGRGERLTEQGYRWEVCHGWKSAVQTLEWYLSLKSEPCRGDMMPDGLSLAEQELFQGLSYLYARYHLKVIDRATGAGRRVR